MKKQNNQSRWILNPLSGRFEKPKSRFLKAVSFLIALILVLISAIIIVETRGKF